MNVVIKDYDTDHNTEAEQNCVLTGETTAILPAHKHTQIHTHSVGLCLMQVAVIMHSETCQNSRCFQHHFTHTGHCA